MPEQNQAGVSNADATGQQTGQTDKTGDGSAAGGQQTAAQAAAGTQNADTAKTTADEVAGLKAAAVAERTKRQEAEAAAKTYQDQLAVAMANRPAQQTQAPQQTSAFKQIAGSLGIDPEYATPEQQGQIIEAMVNSKVQQLANQQVSSQFATQHSDYANVVGRVNPITRIFEIAPPLQRVFQKNPSLQLAMQSLADNPHAGMIAYQLATSDPDYIAEKVKADMTPEQKKAAEAQAAINAANTQQSVSSATGAGGNLDKAQIIANESDAEFQIRKQTIMDKAY